jgi:formylmethanofuran dehydrogenase subunit A
MSVTPADRSVLDHLIRLMDALEDRDRPAYTETCMCGAAVAVGREVSRADLRRIHANFLGRHRTCAGFDAPTTTTPEEDQ